MSQEKLTVSVIIPTYHRPELLFQTLESIWAQTVLPDEIIIGDDSKDDRTEIFINTVVIPKSPVKIRYFHHKPSLREVKNVDFQYRQASYELILHLHDDDPILPGCIEVLVKPFVDNPEIVASFGLQKMIDLSGRIIDTDPTVNQIYYRTPEREGIVDGFIAGAVAMFPNNGFMIRRDIAISVGYDDQGKAGLATDFYFGFRLGQLHRPFYFVNEYTALCRTTPDSQSRLGLTDNNYQTVKLLLDNCLPEDISPEMKESIELRMPAAITYAAYKDKNQAKKWIKSPYYRKHRYTLRWLKRIMIIRNLIK